MKIFTAQQIREGDAYTILHEPVGSINLMERAAGKCVQWIKSRFSDVRPFIIFCGTGNNGGDGLAITRLLRESGYQTQAYLVFYSEKFSDDCVANRSRLEHAFGSCLHAIRTEADFPEISPDAVIVDALFGTGLNRPLKGLAAGIVARINAQANPVIAIDMPSGLMADNSSVGNRHKAAGESIISAAHTLSFECYKAAFLMPENHTFIGQVHILPIGIHPDYIKNTPSSYFLTDEEYIRTVYRRRNRFSHKGTYGHALLIGGSYGKMGAAVLSSGACLHSGAGLLTCHIPSCGYTILQTAMPEAMASVDQSATHWSVLPGGLDAYAAVGIGPGLGQHPETTGVLEELLSVVRKPMVLDADALNIMGKEKRLLEKIPPHAILTPHPKEFERLFGKTKHDFEQLALQKEKSREYNIYIVLKGHYTRIASPGGEVYFNPTGNAGMATAGSGDVLTGLLTGLLAQGYEPMQAALLGVYLHGLSGDLAAGEKSMESMTAPDITACLGKAFLQLNAG